MGGSPGVCGDLVDVVEVAKGVEDDRGSFQSSKKGGEDSGGHTGSFETLEDVLESVDTLVLVAFNRVDGVWRACGYGIGV